ncbi:MAG: VWA domain-containing protein [Acidobacteria bacterium]|nr:VWA domain-containing protein [Acidobacteriota bacterium]
MKAFAGWLLVATLLIGPVASAAGSGQAPVEQRATFRSSADVVTIQASVRDNRGRPVKGLKPSDFEVRDNGLVRSILSLRSDLRSPLSLAILVDMSGSMRLGSTIGSKIALARHAFHAVLAELHDGQDEVAVFSFDSSLRQRQPFTSNLSELRGALDDFQPFGTTSLYDATAATAQRLAGRSATHKAIVVLTDGTDTSSSLTAADVSGLASSISVPVYIVATFPAGGQPAKVAEGSLRSEADDLRDLAEWTGGQLVWARNFTETSVVASGFVTELRQQYVLAVEAAAAREWRRLNVRVKHSSAVVKARSGYFGG